MRYLCWHPQYVDTEMRIRVKVTPYGGSLEQQSQDMDPTRPLTEKALLPEFDHDVITPFK